MTEARSPVRIYRGDFTNTLFGLKSKKAELETFLKRIEAEKREVTRQLAALDRSIELLESPPEFLARFDPPQTVNRQVFIQFLCETLPQFNGDFTTATLAKGWLDYIGLEKTQANKGRANGRVRWFLNGMVREGLAELVSLDDRGAVWRVTGQLPRRIAKT